MLLIWEIREYIYLYFKFLFKWIYIKYFQQNIANCTSNGSTLAHDSFPWVDVCIEMFDMGSPSRDEDR